MLSQKFSDIANKLREFSEDVLFSSEATSIQDELKKENVI